MKKQIVLIVFFLGLIMTFSCEKDAGNACDDSLQHAILSIESQIYSNDLKAFTPLQNIVNIKYFDFFTKLSEAKSTEERNNARKYFDEVATKSSRNELLPEEEDILKSYFNIIVGRSYKDKLSISDIYVSEIVTLKLSSQSKEKVRNIICFYRDLLVYLDSRYNANYKTSQGNKDVEWDCRHYDCFDCCIRSHLEDIENSNWIEKAYFISNIAINTAILGLSCGWDCLTQ